MPKKLDFNFIKNEFESYDYELLETEYINAKTKMRYKCLKHPEKISEVTWNKFQQGRRCRYCHNDSLKLDYDFIREEFNNRGYKLLSGEYVNAHTILMYQCLTHADQILTTTYNNFKRGGGCRKCGYKTLKHNYDFINQAFKARGYELLETEYINAKTKMKFKCFKHPDKETSISYNSLNKGSGCYYCGIEQTREYQIETHKNTIKGIRDLTITHPNLIDWVGNKELLSTLSYSSNRRIEFTCPTCKTNFIRGVAHVCNSGINCPLCGDGLSYPERFMFNLLKNLKVDFETNKKFNWSEGKLYDFYIENQSTIIETHGLQHYEDTGFSYLGGRTLQEEQKNDIFKQELALKNGICHYIIIDCRYSNYNFIRESILISQMYNLYILNNIDWDHIAIESTIPLTKRAGQLWNEGKCISDIANELKLSRQTITKYLKICSQLKLCDYNLEESQKRGGKKLSLKRFFKCICLTTNEIFDSVNVAANKYNINSVGIQQCCRKKQQFSGKHPETSEKLAWEYYNSQKHNIEDYIVNI